MPAAVNKPRILIVEDEAIVARDLQLQLADLGYEPVGHAERGSEAIVLAGQLRPDLVLMDIRLAREMDGIDAAQAIRTQFSLPVVYLTAYSDEESLRRAAPTEPYGYIVKPFSMREVHAVIEMALYAHKVGEKLRESEARYRALFENASEGIFYFSVTDTTIAFVNESFARMHGYTVDEMAGMNLRQLDGPDTARLIPERTTRLAAGEHLVFEVEHYDKDGRLFPLEVSASLVSLGGKNVVLAFHRDITERKRAETALRESERRLSTVFQVSPVGIVVSRFADGKILDVNDAALRLYGYTRAEVLGRTVAELGTYSNPAQREEMVQQLRERGIIDRFLVAGSSSHGQPMLIEMSARTIDLDGEDCLVSMIADVTERTNAAEKVRESELRYRTLFDRAPAGILYMSPADGRIISVNEAFAAMHGYSIEELMSMNLRDLDTPDVVRHLPGRIARILAGETLTFETEHYHKDGHVVPFEVLASTVSIGGERRIQAFHTDITERREADRALRLESAALEAAANAIVITNTEGVIESTNAAFSTFTGYRAAEAIGRTHGELVKSGTHSPAFYQNMWDTIRAGRVWHGEVVNRRKNGTLYTEEMTITPLMDGDRRITHYIAVKQDISERKRLEEQFRQAQKMESIGRLAGGVAHDFNNMLGVILGNVELALNQVDLEQPLHADLVEIRDAAKRSAALTRQLLTFARKEPAAPQTLNVNRSVAATLKILRRLIGTNIEVTWHPGIKVWPITMDPTQLDQILTNLCVNARDAISGTGTITIATTNSVIDAAYAAHLDAEPGDYVRLTVRDNGCGMDEKTLTRMFEPFFTTKPTGEANGLGLSAVYGAVKQNHGFITVSSEPGKGTVFEIHLPRPAPEAAPAPTANAANMESAAAAGPHSWETILLVEDEPSVLKLAAKVLRAQGYTVLQADGPSEAIRVTREHVDEIHLLLTDVVMPGMNGQELANTLLSLRPKLKRLYMSGYSEGVMAHDGLLTEGASFIQKPFLIKDLQEKVRQTLDSGGA